MPGQGGVVVAVNRQNRTDLVRGAILAAVSGGESLEDAVVASVMDDWEVPERVVALEVTCLVAFGRLVELPGGKLGLPPVTEPKSDLVTEVVS